MASELEINWYEVLDCTIDSTKADIQKAVRKLSLKYHSDKTDDPEAPAKFLEIQRAKEVLLDDAKRKEIDDKIRANLKRKEHESRRIHNMDENRKRMRENLEKSVKMANSNSVPMAAKGSFDQKYQNKVNTASKDPNAINKLRRDAASRKESLEEETSKRDRITEEYLAQLRVQEQQRQTRNQVKIKWKKNRESHSEESLYHLFKQYGTIEEILLNAEKGTSATVTFSDEASAVACLRAFDLSTEYRVSQVLNDKKKSPPPVFNYNYKKASEEQTSSKLGNSSIHNESELLDMVRRAVEREKLLHALEQSQSQTTTSLSNENSQKPSENFNVPSSSVFEDTNTSSQSFYNGGSHHKTDRGDSTSTSFVQPPVNNVLSMEENILMRMRRKKVANCAPDPARATNTV